MQDHNEKLQQLHEMVETTIDLDEIDRHNYIIKPEFDEELQELKGQLETMRDELDTEHATVAEDLGMETDNKTLHFEQSPMGYTFRLTKKVRSRGALESADGLAGGSRDPEQESIYRAAEQSERHPVHHQEAQDTQRRLQVPQRRLRQEAEESGQGGDQHCWYVPSSTSDVSLADRS